MQDVLVLPQPDFDWNIIQEPGGRDEAINIAKGSSGFGPKTQR